MNCQHDNLEWRFCDNHSIGRDCYMEVCVDCGITVSRDCNASALLEADSYVTISLTRKFAYEYEMTAMPADATDWEWVKMTKSRVQVRMSTDRALDALGVCDDRVCMGGEGYEFSVGRVTMFRSAAKSIRAALGLPQGDL